MKANRSVSKEEIEKPPRQRLIEAATKLFCRHGINATGIDALLKEARVAKMSLYNIFGSKDRLVEAVLEEEGRLWRSWFLSALNAGTASPRRKLERIFPLLRTWFAEEHFYGCPLINAVAEHNKSDLRLREIAMRHKKEVLQRFTALADAAGAADAEGLAHQIGLLMDGAIVTVMVTRDVALADAAAKAASTLIDQAIAAKKTSVSSVPEGGRHVRPPSKLFSGAPGSDAPSDNADRQPAQD